MSVLPSLLHCTAGGSRELVHTLQRYADQWRRRSRHTQLLRYTAALDNYGILHTDDANILEGACWPCLLASTVSMPSK